MTLDKQKLEANQAKNDQAEKELDQELKDVQEDEGDSIEPEEEPQKPEEDVDEDQDQEEDEEDDSSDDEDSDEEPEDDQEEEPEKPKDDSEDEPEADRERPKKYIPLPKYQEEKKAWQSDKQKLEEANKIIDDLKKVDSKKQTEDEEEKALEKLAEKWDTPIEFLKDVKGVVEKGGKIKPETIVEKKETEEKPVENGSKAISQEEIVKRFDDEFTSFESTLKKQYPNATTDQLAEAKKVMDEFAHTEEFGNYKLGHIMKINSSDFKEILGKTKNNPGIEGGKPGNRGVQEMTSKSFKKDADGNYNFKSLHKMENGLKKEELVDSLSVDAWDAYVQDLDYQSEMKVTKNDGRIIALK